MTEPAPGQPGSTDATRAPGVNSPETKGLGVEIVIVLALSLGRSAVYSILNLIERLTRPELLSSQTTSMNSAVTPDRPWLDLSYQLAQILFGVAPAALAIYLLIFRAGPMLWGRTPFAALGLDLRRPWFDLSRGFALLAVIGIPGIGIYLGARALHLNTTIAAANLGENWWTIPILILAALEASIVEEVVIVGYLVVRLTQLGWSWWQVLLLSAVVRASYHLYQGIGQGIGNLLMGLILAAVFLRWKRLGPLLVVHLLLDLFSFVGYTLLAPVVDWL